MGAVWHREAVGTGVEAHNDDTGTLKVGAVAVKPGDGIRIVGEEKIRAVTYVFGRSPNTRAACRGSGAFPIGHVRSELLPPEAVPASAAPPPKVRRTTAGA